MLFGDLMKKVCASWDIDPNPFSYLDYVWGIPKMKPGLEVAAVAINAMIATAHANCPDYTTYAQVDMFKLEDVRY